MPSQHPRSPLIRGNIPILDLLAIFPKAAEVLAAYGLSCFSCPFGGSESLEEGCKAHGFPKEVTRALLRDLQRLCVEKARRGRMATMTITARGVREAQKMAKEEERRAHATKGAKGRAPKRATQQTLGLRVQLDGQGRFCMEFRTKPERGDDVIRNTGKSFPLFIPRLLSGRLDGATIDFREGRFQLDLQGEKQDE